MSDKNEVEIKFAVDDPTALRERLLKVGATPIGERAETNTRFDTPERKLAAQDILLRIRKVETDFQTRYFVTVKTRTEADIGDLPPTLRARREIEFTIDEGEAMVTALGVLGYEPSWRYEKQRETFILGEIEAVIDVTPMGTFLEVEGERDGIEEVLTKLGLDLEDGSASSYAEIFDCVRQTLDLKIADLTFEAFAGVTVDPDVARTCCREA